MCGACSTRPTHLSVRAQLRKIIKTGGHFLHDDAADKLIWLALRMSRQNGNGAAVLEIRDEPIRDSVRRSLHPADRGMMHGAMFFSVARSPVDGTFPCGVDANRREPKA